jgi:hypothetical protein
MKLILINMKTLLMIMAMFGSSAFSYAQSFVATLKPAPFGATGNGSADFNLSGTMFSVISGSYQGLGASPIEASLSEKPPGSGIVSIYTFTVDPTTSTSGTFSGSVNLTEQQIGYLDDGYLSVVIYYSNVFPEDQINGPIEEVPEPSALALLGVGSIALLRKWPNRRSAL